MVHTAFHDADNNNMLEPGDTVSLSFKLRNYNYGVGCDNATFSLITEDPSIIILDNSCSADIPADDFFILDNVFKFKITDAGSTYLANFQLITTADVEITWGDTIYFEVLVAPSGILVYQGEGTGNAFSGDYINEFLVDQGHQVFYTSHFPSSLIGFDAVFLSFGNYGDELSDGVVASLEMTEVISEYLYQGGRIYDECGSVFGGMAFLGYPNLEEMMELFGVEEYEMPLTYNNLEMLNGQPGSICHDLVFTGSTQSPNWYINIMTPNDNGVAAFEEEGYGMVAVQGEGEYGQRTFCFSYALAHLEDGSQGTKDELLTRIVDFLLLGVGVEDIISENQIQEMKVFPSPFKENTNIHFTLSNDSYIKLEIFDLTGNQVAVLCDKKLQSGAYTFNFNGEYLARGVYCCCLQSDNQVVAKKIIKH